MSTGSRPQNRTVEVQDGAEAFVELLLNNGVEYIFINSGTDTFAVLEAISRMVEQERKIPEIVLCLDETTAMSAAHGYWQSTGRPQVVMVHVDAGTMAIGGAYHNAQRDHAAIVVVSGRAPLTIESGLPGERDNIIHWTQEQRDQAGAVRTFTKWDYEIRHAKAMPLVVHKAFQVATAEPSGPVYLQLPRELLLEPLDGVELPAASRHAAPVPPAPDTDAIAQLADWLLNAERPVLIPGAYGRHPGAVDDLVALVEATGTTVVTERARTRASFPSNHPQFAGINQQPLAEADIVLVLDSDVPWVQGHGGPNPEARIAWVDIDAAKETIPLWTFGADLLIHASSDKAVAALLGEVQRQITGAQKTRIAERIGRTAAAVAERRQTAATRVEKDREAEVITPAYLASCLDAGLSQDTILLSEAVSSSGEVMTYVERTQPATLYQSGGSSLGWALGAALGHKLATPGRDVVALVGDGAFVFGCPTSSLWGAEQYDAPFLTVIFNNSMHFAVKRALEGGYPDSSAKRTGHWRGIDITPSPDYAILAQASRAYGERVDSPSELPAAIQRGLERVHAGQAAVLDVRIQRF